MLSYEDGIAAMNWLQNVFEFEVGGEMFDSEGKLSHGELVLQDQKLMLANGSSDYRNPNHMREEYAAAGKWLHLPYIFNGVLIYVDDLEATYRRAADANAEILSEIETGFPGRRFRMADPEGHRWFVFQNEA